MTTASEENGDISIVFQSREQVIVQRGQIRRIGWVIKTLETQVGHFLLGCKCPVSRSIFVQEQDHLGEILIAFSVQGTGGSPTGPDPENRVGGQDIGSPGRQFLLGCTCQVSQGIVLQEQDILGDLPAEFFLQNVLQLHQRR